MKSFLKEALTTFKTTGTVRPSSKYLINKILKSVDFSRSLVIVEFGAGDGCITAEVARRMTADSQLHSFEINEQFLSFCEKKFSNQSNVKIVNHSAFEFDEYLREQGIDHVDYIISSLPLALFKPSMVQRLLNKVNEWLDEDGQFYQYQYSLGNYGQLRKNFDSVSINFTARNLPPAFIYTCS